MKEADNSDGATAATAATVPTLDKTQTQKNPKKQRQKRPPIIVKRNKEKWNAGRYEDVCEVGNIVFHPPQYLGRTVKTYDKRVALRYVSKTRKGSAERYAMMKYMVDEGFVPIKLKAFYKLVHNTEVKRLPVGDDKKWNGVGRPTREAAAKKNKDGCGNGWMDRNMFPMHKEAKIRAAAAKKVINNLDWKHDRAKRSLWEKAGWKGSIRFPPYMLAPIAFDTDLVDVAKRNIEYRRPKYTDLCSYIGEECGDIDTPFADLEIVQHQVRAP